MRSRVQLPIAVGPRSAFAETVVAVDIDGPFLSQTPEIEATRLHLSPTIDHDRRNTVPGEFITAEQSGRSVSDDDDTSTPCNSLRRWSNRFFRLAGTDGNEEKKLHATATGIERPPTNGPLEHVGGTPP